MSLPTTFRRILAAGMILAAAGSISSSALIQAELAKAQFEKARHSSTALEDKLGAIDNIAPDAVVDFNLMGKGAK